MKKLFRLLLVTAVAVLALCCVAMAVEADPPYVEKADGVSATVTLQAGYEKVDATYNDAAVTVGGQYMFFLVKKNESDAYVPGETTVLFMDQVTATVAGTVSYTGMYPAKMDDCAVMISGTGLPAPKVIGYIVVPEPPYTLGDVNEDGEPTAKDALLVLQHSVKSITLDARLQLAANVNGDADISAKDALLILQHSVGLIDKFPIE